jgi:hypothetical protein
MLFLCFIHPNGFSFAWGFLASFAIKFIHLSRRLHIVLSPWIHGNCRLRRKISQAVNQVNGRVEYLLSLWKEANACAFHPSQGYKMHARVQQTWP